MFRAHRPHAQRPEPDAIEVIIGPRATFTGALHNDTSIRVDGVVEDGYLETPANIVLTETAQVHGELRCRTVSIRGRFTGTIHADRAELLSGCHVSGALYVNSFLMDEGALFDGELHMLDAAESSPTSAQPA